MSMQEIHYNFTIHKTEHSKNIKYNDFRGLLTIRLKTNYKKTIYFYIYGLYN
jgi:hypothetical protein